MRKKIIKITLWILVIIWMITILSFSSESAEFSDNKSRTIVQIIMPLIEKLNIEISIDQLNHYIRKTAHIFNYFLLSILLTIAWRLSFTNKAKYTAPYIIATIFSAIDEFFQTFINGRGGRLSDVMIDNIGILLALLLIYLITREPRGRFSWPTKFLLLQQIYRASIISLQSRS